MTVASNPSGVDATERSVPELLAPAGAWDCLHAAVANGADAVYFGLESFNARRRAENFKLAELPDVIAYLHARCVKGYVTVNTLIFSDELEQALDYASAIAQAGADAVIVQDLGLLHVIRRLTPSLAIHASTQMTQTEAQGIELLRDLGISRVILARELALCEIERIAKATPMPLEVFVHGALCVSYSGQCLASESLWGRSANRGLCAQACRLPYQLVVDGCLRDMGDRQYLLSPRDLAALDRIPELVRLGTIGFKIEGRLKSPQYVAAATSAYRAAIDAAAQRSSFTATPEQNAELALSFSRGLCRGFLDGADHQRLVHGRFPKSRGIYIGTVAGKTNRGVLVQLAVDGHAEPAVGSGSAPRRGERHAHASSFSPSQPPAWPLRPGDGVVFDEGHPEQDEQGGRVYSVGPAPDDSPICVELSFGRGKVNLAAIAVGSRVWKTDDPQVRRRLSRTAQPGRPVRRIRLHVRVRACCGEPLTLWLRDDTGNEVQAAADAPLQPAKKHPLTIELLREQLGRLGDTPFELASVELSGPDDASSFPPVMAPKSLLNQLRRRAVEELSALRAEQRRHKIVEPDVLDRIRTAISQRLDAQTVPAAGEPGRSSMPALAVLTRTFEQFEAAMDWARSTRIAIPETVYCDFQEPGLVRQAVAAARGGEPKIGLAAPRVIMPGEEAVLEEIANLAPQVVLVRSLGELRFFRRRLPDAVLVGDHSLNVANEVSASVLADIGLARLTPSYDLDWRQLSAMASRISPALFEVVIHQHVPLFHTRHCLFAANMSCGSSCADCGRPCEQHALRLRDRLGVEHPVLTDGLGRNTVFNAAVQSAAELAPAMLRLGLRHFRIEFLEESAKQARSLLDLYAGLLGGEIEPASALRRLRTITASPVTHR